MEMQREASGTLGSRPINASVSDKRKSEVALPLPLSSGALARPLNEDHGMSSYEEYFDSLKEGEEAMSKAEYDECLSPQGNLKASRHF
ncbi:hypothetical protein [Rahnella sp. PCH160]|uniref:hypothetical protein n=1 Tax=Rahnella sp. PCH160 TaxID=3447928 RepID=UPI0039FCFC2A